MLCLVTHLCPTLSDSMNCNPPGSSVHRISQARILEWVIISSSRKKIFQDCAQVDFLANQDRSRQTPAGEFLKSFRGRKLTEEVPTAWFQWVVHTDLESPTSKEMTGFSESVLGGCETIYG